MASGWEDLEDEQIAQLDEHDFEQLCVRLVDYETIRRHPKSAKVSSPVNKGAKDGGRDILVSLSEPPEQDERDYRLEHSVRPLTEDPRPDLPRTRIAYSCKTGDNWLDLARRDARDPRLAVRAAEVLAEGGYFKLFVNVNVVDDRLYKRKLSATGELEERTAEAHISAEFWHRLRQDDPEAEDPSSRIEIIDAHRIASYLRQLQPAGGNYEPLRAKLSLGAVLDNLDDWRRNHQKDRKQPPPLVQDERREVIRDELLAWLKQSPGDDRCAALVGNPGVGKTRLVLEALASDPTLRQRARVALSPDRAIGAIENGVLRTQPQLILVVDDCLVHELARVTARFESAVVSQKSARLVVLVPSAHAEVESTLEIDQSWSLEPLGTRECRVLVGSLLEREPTDVDVVAIANYVEGFPWFARLLVDEYKQAGVPPQTMREALKWALASRREAQGPELEALRLRRARTLLAASLVRAEDWTQFDPDRQDALARAVGLDSWELLIDTANACVQRGLLRRSRGWTLKYVTPLILEREVYRWLLGPDGSDPGGRRLHKRLAAATLGDALVRAVQRLPGLSEIELGLVESLLDQFSRSTLVDLEGEGLLRESLHFLLQRAPVELASALRLATEASELGALRERLQPQHRVVRVLERLVSTPECFEAGEAALFRLMEAGVASPARARLGAWARSFLFGFDVPLGSRIDRLATRLRAPSASARRLALSGLEALLSTRVDHMEPESSTDAIRAAHTQGWSLLGDRLEDPDPDVRDAAQDLAIKLLPSAIRSGVGTEAMTTLADKASSFGDRARVRLLHKLDEVDAHEAQLLDATSGQPAGLREALRPRSYADILHQRVGMWGEASLRDEDEPLDDIVAKAGLGEGVPLRAELPWLLDPEAERAHVFAYAIGRADVDAQLFDELCELARAHPSLWRAQALLARYLGGMLEVERDRARELGARLREDPKLASAGALAALEFGVEGMWVDWLTRALEAQLVEAFAINELGHRAGSLGALTDAQALGLLRAMVELDAGASAALRLLLARFGGDSSAMPFELLARLLEQLEEADTSGLTGYDWERGAKLLCEHDPSRAATIALGFLTAHRSESLAWPVLHQAAELAPAATLELILRKLDEPSEGWHLALAFEHHTQPFAWPAEPLLAWVGDDRERAYVAARAALVRVDSEQLPDVLRELLHRFGPDSEVASVIGNSMLSRGGFADDMVEHDRKALARARAWSRDEDPVVAQFAMALCETIERVMEHHLAVEAELNLRLGA